MKKIMTSLPFTCCFTFSSEVFDSLKKKGGGGNCANSAFLLMAQTQIHDVRVAVLQESIYIAEGIFSLALLPCS